LQFLLIFRKAAAGELKNDGLMEVYRHICEVDVGAEGVKGAKNFFEAKVPFFTYIQLLAQQVCPRNHVHTWFRRHTLLATCKVELDCPPD